MPRQLLCLILVISSLLYGCGYPVLVKQESATEVSSGKNVIDEINAFNDTIYTNQTQLAVTLLATHPDCKYSENYILVHTALDSKNLCLADKEIALWQYDKSLGQKIILFPAAKSALLATNQVLSALSKYLDGLSQYTTDPSHPFADDIQKTLDELNTTYSSVQQFIPADANQTEGVIQPLTNSLPAMIGFFTELKQNAADASAIKVYMQSQSNAVGKLEAVLNKIAENAGRIYGTVYFNNSRLIADTLSNFYNKNLNGKEFSTEKNREDFLYRVLQQKQLANQIKQMKDPVTVAISQFNSAHKNLMNLLNKNLSDEDKAKISAENVKEFNDGLKKLADLANFALKLAAL